MRAGAAAGTRPRRGHRRDEGPHPRRDHDDHALPTRACALIEGKFWLAAPVVQGSMQIRNLRTSVTAALVAAVLGLSVPAPVKANTTSTLLIGAAAAAAALTAIKRHEQEQ